MKLFELTNKEKERIFSKISINEKNGCWIWTAANNRGYGVFNLRGNVIRIHRLLYTVYIGELPKYDGINVLDHVICNNPSCCNPSHVKLVKQSFNILRSNSASGINLRKTHCIHGHKLPKPTEQYGTNGKLGRRCIICRRRNRMNRYYASKSISP